MIHWARLRGAYNPTYAKWFAYCVGIKWGDRGIRQGLTGLCAARRPWCAAVKPLQNDKIFAVKASVIYPLPVQIFVFVSVLSRLSTPQRGWFLFDSALFFFRVCEMFCDEFDFG
jgi:hypothetical protein